jgi:hypothetical protein
MNKGGIRKMHYNEKTRVLKQMEIIKRSDQTKTAAQTRVTPKQKEGELEDDSSMEEGAIEITDIAEEDLNEMSPGNAEWGIVAAMPSPVWNCSDGDDISLGSSSVDTVELGTRLQEKVKVRVSRQDEDLRELSYLTSVPWCWKNAGYRKGKYAW